MTNSADPDQLASEEANWSGSILFVKAGYIKGQLMEHAIMHTIYVNTQENVQTPTIFTIKIGTPVPVPLQHKANL